jgi:hypothetical protein
VAERRSTGRAWRLAVHCLLWRCVLIQSGRRLISKIVRLGLMHDGGG